ncbi:tyrosine-type recombinase/integrase [Burkholderia multivorans]|uniref:tyrosine-type recombinase/integrase n=1 Tax=Burkholderia multivorans TaxID=87883 RepID=UPI0007520734|nr:site-specific integrase [Burkholderia multivorans]KVS13145.1 integrase [Burkholderia multivorans]MBU9652851.1 site-specific integrase [Burkholderia multivorans]MCO1451092.1 site-specific integrase [Burkholderia multivorans]MDN8103938.1 site-specific integrase [Burkholderia multivorans]
MSNTIKRAAVLLPGQIRHLLRVTEATSRHPARDAVILLLGLSVGMRITEVAQITVADIMFRSGTLRREVSLRAAITKGCRQRSVYFSSRKLVDAIERYLEYRVAHELGTTLDRSRFRGLNPDIPLILSRKGYPYALNRKIRISADGEPIDYWAADSLQSYVTGLYKAAGLRASSHSGRRTFATRLLGRGATIEQVKLLLGHESIDDTRRYIEVDGAVLRRILESAI